MKKNAIVKANAFFFAIEVYAGMGAMSFFKEYFKKHIETTEVITSAMGKAHHNKRDASGESVNSHAAGNTNIARRRAEMTSGKTAWRNACKTP